MKKQLNTGFTLIELLVVIAIIGILASVILASLNTARSKARDSKRISDLQELQKALEMYYFDYGTYPGATGHYKSSAACAYGGGSAQDWSTIFDSSFTSTYLPSLPVDPTGGSTSSSYCYGYSTFAKTPPSTSNTIYNCVAKDGTVVDVDGVDASGTITGRGYNYVLVFTAETDQSNNFMKFNGSSTQYCILGPSK
jgi:type II secretion system protein G